MNLPDTKDCEEMLNEMKHNITTLIGELYGLAIDICMKNIDKHYDFSNSNKVDDDEQLIMQIATKTSPAVALAAYNTHKHSKVFDAPEGTNEKIKTPCPFCGSMDIEIITHPMIVVDWQAHCKNCLIDGPTAPSPEMAIQHWEKREG